MIRVGLADDRPLVRQGLSRILEREGGFTVVFDEADAHAVFNRLQTTRCDVLILDVQMPGPGFFETMTRILRDANPPKVLVLSGLTEEQHGVRALQAGALGYLHKDVDPALIVEGVRVVASGRRFITPSLADVLASRLSSTPEEAPHHTLSRREFEVLRLIGSGLGTDEVARALHISPKTVATYRSRIYEKLHVRSVAQLIRYAVERGLTTTEHP